MPRLLMPAVALLAAITLPATAVAQGQRTVSVSGESSLSARNDTARLSFGVETRRRGARAALNASSARLRKIIAALGASGIESRDLRTGPVRVARVRGSRGKRLRRFAARGGVRAVVREVRRTGAVIDAAVRAGATSTHGPSFFISDPRAVFRRALSAAFRDARAKAAQLAGEAGLVLGSAVSIREGSFQAPEQRGAVGAPRTGDPRRRKAAPIRPGTSSVDATVFVVFEAR